MTGRLVLPDAIVMEMLDQMESGGEENEEPDLIEVDNDNEDSIVPYALREGSK